MSGAAGKAGSSGSAGTGGVTGCEADADPIDLERCPGMPLVLSGSPPSATASGSTNNLSDDHADCSGDGSDAVYRFVAPADGTVRITLRPNGIRGTLYARATTCGSGTLLVCQNPGTIGTAATGTFPVTRCTRYYVFADQDIGILNGSFELEIRYE
jgi:hypothetical protein